MEVVFGSNDFKGTVSILRGADRGALVAGGDRYGSLLLGLLQIVFATQNELVGLVVLFHGEPLCIGRGLPGRIGLNVDDDFAAEAFEVDGCIQVVFRFEPGVVRNGCPLGINRASIPPLPV